MIQALALALPQVASSIGITILDAPQPPDFAGMIQQFAAQFATEATAVMTAIDSAVIDIARASYVTCLLLGAMLYFTHLSRRLGKDLVVGGVVLVVLSEYVIPAVIAASR